MAAGEQKSSMVQRYSSDLESFDIGDTKVQHYGLLMKKPFGHKSTRWQKRFFIVKEGFLLYYNESENKVFERSHHFNIHPKGVIPLGGCKVTEAVSGSQKFAIKITNDNYRGEIWVGADNEEDCTKWVSALKEAGTVTWRNAQLGERIIMQLEDKGKQMTDELKGAIDKLNEEASALEVEKEKKEELEALAAKLEEEKRQIEASSKNLREEKDTAAQELQQTIEAMTHIQEEKESLSKQTSDLQSYLETVSEEKEKTAAELEERERLAKQLEDEKKSLEEATTNLKGNLMTMEERQKQIEQERDATVTRLRDQELTAQKLAEEKKQISTTALHLQANLQQVEQEKEATEDKYKKEKKKRMNTERRLRLAEDSLKRLDKALQDSGVKIDLQIETDVKNLKVFFEECIKEEQYEAQKLDIFRDAVRAKATYNVETKKMEGNSVGGSESDSLPTSPRELSPLPTEETNGKTEVVNGKGEETNAKGEESNGKGEETNGKGEETNGKGEETNGKGEETNGKGEETNGKGEETNAKGEETNGKGEETNAKGEETNAKGEETNEKGEETNAKGEETNGKIENGVEVSNGNGTHTDCSS